MFLAGYAKKIPSEFYMLIKRNLWIAPLFSPFWWVWFWIHNKDARLQQTLEIRQKLKRNRAYEDWELIFLLNTLFCYFEGFSIPQQWIFHSRQRVFFLPLLYKKCTQKSKSVSYFDWSKKWHHPKLCNVEPKPDFISSYTRTYPSKAEWLHQKFKPEVCKCHGKGMFILCTTTIRFF